MPKDESIQGDREIAVLERPQYMGEDRYNAVFGEQNAPEPDQEDPSEELDAEEATYKKRYADARRYMQNKDKEHKEEMEAIRREVEDLKENPLNQIDVPDERIEAFRMERPDEYEMYAAIAAKQTLKLQKKMQRLQEDYENEKSKNATSSAVAYVAKAHPDWEEVRVSDEFYDWVKAQSPVIRDAIENNDQDGPLVAKLVTLFKVETNYGRSKNTEQDDSALHAAALIDVSTNTTPRNNAKKWKASDVDKMTIEQYEAHESEIKAAMRNGDFIQDIK